MPVARFIDEKINAACGGLNVGSPADESQDLLSGELLKIRAGSGSKNRNDLPSVRSGSRSYRRGVN